MNDNSSPLEEKHRKKVDARFGELALKLGILTRAQLDETLLLQRCAREHRPLGMMLLDLKILKEADLDKIIEAQKAYAIASEVRARVIHDDNLFGKVAIRLHLCNEKQLKECIEIQDRLPKDQIQRLGEIMVNRAVLSAPQLQQILDMQKALVISCPSCNTRYNTVMFNPGIVLPCHSCGTMIQIPGPPPGVTVTTP